MKINCPDCGKEIQIAPAAAWQENTMTMTYELKEGHFLQARTLGESMAATAKLLKAVAKELHQEIEVMVSDVRFSERKISVDYVSMAKKSGEV
jgi:hypothetical protein